MTEPAQAKSVVVLEPSQVPDAHAVAAAHDVEVVEVPHRGIEPVITVTLLLVGSAAAVGAVVHILDQYKGGQVIDLRLGAPKAFYRTRDVVYGIVVIVTGDGKVTVTVNEPVGMFGKVISALPGLLFGGSGAKQVTKLVNEAFGADVRTDTVGFPPPGGDT